MYLSDYFNAYVLSCREYPERLAEFDQRAEELGVKGIEPVFGSHGSLIGKPN